MKEPPIVRKPMSPTAPNAMSGSSLPTRANNAKWGGLLESRLAILGLLFGVTGFLGIPVLWMSPAFSRNEKIAWSVAVTIYTLVLIAIAVAICWWSYNQIRHLI